MSGTVPACLTGLALKRMSGATAPERSRAEQGWIGDEMRGYIGPDVGMRVAGVGRTRSGYGSRRAAVPGSGVPRSEVGGLGGRESAAHNDSIAGALIVRYDSCAGTPGVPIRRLACQRDARIHNPSDASNSGPGDPGEVETGCGDAQYVEKGGDKPLHPL